MKENKETRENEAMREEKAPNSSHKVGTSSQRRRSQEVELAT